MSEFIATSSLYKEHKQGVDGVSTLQIQGHIFCQGDLQVRVGILTVNYPKIVLV